MVRFLDTTSAMRTLQRTNPPLKWYLVVVMSSLLVLSGIYAANMDRFPGDLPATLSIQSAISPSLLPLAASISIEENKLIILPLMVLTVVGLYLFDWKKELYFLLLSTVSGAIVVEIAKEVIARPRPSPEFVWVLQDTSSYSYPSGNAALFGLFFIALAIVLASRVANKHWAIAIWGVVASLLLFVGVSRIYLGSHWPSDVIAGYVLALVWALITRNTLLKLFSSANGNAGNDRLKGKS